MRRYLAATVGMIAILGLSQSEDTPRRTLPDSPQTQLTRFQLPGDLRMELVASEPKIVDPVAMAFDEFNRLYVCEMLAYPNKGIARGELNQGRIVRLEDRDGDGQFETSTVFADGLRLPNSVMPYRDGVLVSDAPSIWYLRDTNQDGVADEKQILYTGFDLSNIQMLPNALQWGLDNRIHALGGNGGTITSPTEKNFKPYVLRGRGFTFRPDDLLSFQPTSGGGQYGLTSDAWGHWFTATNSQHLRQIILPDHYLSRNPNLPVAQTTLDIPEHGAACKVFRISPFEAWRVERTTPQKG